MITVITTGDAYQPQAPVTGIHLRYQIGKYVTSNHESSGCNCVW